MNSAKRGSLIAGTWLIGIGVVFLIRQVLDLSWSQAWPLFVILVGVATLVQTALAWQPTVAGVWTFTWPIVWIAVGVVLFLSTTGRLGTGPGELIAQGWPWLLIALGVWFIVGSIAPDTSSTDREH
jgi:cell wall-active antibiotic response 4TMS protein YvqF